jgi:WD40 repeat protein
MNILVFFKTIKVWSLAGYNQTVSINLTSPIRDLESISNSSLASASGDRYLRVWSILNGGLLFTSNALDGNLVTLKSLSKSYLAGGTTSSVVYIWSIGEYNTDGFNLTIWKTLRGHISAITGLDLVGVSYLVSSDINGTVNLWNFTSGFLVGHIVGMASNVSFMRSLTQTPGIFNGSILNKSIINIKSKRSSNSNFSNG